MRQCPTPEGEYHPLIAHRITSALCLARQRDFYHKCHRCRYRGQPAGLCLEDEPMVDDGAGVVNVEPTAPDTVAVPQG